MISSFEVGVELNPSDSIARNCYGHYLALAGQPDTAIENLETAIRISPRDPWMYHFRLGMARAHFAAANYGQTVDWAQRSIERKPNGPAYRLMAASYAHLGEMDEAQVALGDLLRVQPTFTLAGLRRFYAGMDPDFSERVVAGLQRSGLEN